MVDPPADHIKQYRDGALDARCSRGSRDDRVESSAPAATLPPLPTPHAGGGGAAAVAAVGVLVPYSSVPGLVASRRPPAGGGGCGRRAVPATARSAAMAPPTVPPHVPVSKHLIPELPTEFTDRPRLWHLLDRAAPGQVIVVSAPGGSGKTLLLADWVRSGDGPETAWISLGLDDNDPRRLWAAVVTALLAVPSVTADHRLQRLLTDVTRKPAGDVVEALAAALDVLDLPVRLVLDDVHELIGTQVLRDLARLVRSRPAGVRLVPASRPDPP